MPKDMVAHIAKVLRQAEGEREAGNLEAAENIMARAVALSQAHTIDLAVARAHTARQERVEQPERRQFKVGDVGVAANKNAHFADLMIAVCEGNGVEVTISGNSVYVWGHGMPSDLDLCERFFALLSVQMVQEADAGLRRGDNGEWVEDAVKTRKVEIPEDEREWGGRKGWVEHDGESAYYDERDEVLEEDPNTGKMRRYREWYDQHGYRQSGWVESRQPPKYRNEPVVDPATGEYVRERKWVSREDGRVWRANFYQGFVNRVRYRLREARAEALREAGIDVEDESDERALALRDKEKEVRDYFEEENRLVLSTGRYHKGAQVNNYSGSGQLHGDRAGQAATIGNERVVGS